MKMSEINDLSEVELEKKFRELGNELLQLQVRKQNWSSRETPSDKKYQEGSC